MTSVQKRSFSLTEVQAHYIDNKVASGAFASGSEVIREGLRALQMRDAAIEKWLREDVAAATGVTSPYAPEESPMEKVYERLKDQINALPVEDDDD